MEEERERTAKEVQKYDDIIVLRVRECTRGGGRDEGSGSKGSRGRERKGRARQEYRRREEQKMHIEEKK